MLKFIKSLFVGRPLSDALRTDKKIKIRGVRFVIKKLDPLAVLESPGILTKTFHVKEFATSKDDVTLSGSEGANVRAYKKHLKDVFLAAVISPRLVQKESAGGVLVDELFNDWALTSELYLAIMEHTYGKKKINSALQPFLAQQ
jgi:hypothetical protein